MNRRTFLVLAGAPAVAAALPGPLLATPIGGGTVALVTADLEAHIVAVETATGRIVKRIRTIPGPRSIESNGFGQALVAHTTRGRLSLIDAATLRVEGEIGGLGEPRYTAMHPSERVAFVSDSKREEIAVVDLVKRKVIHRVRVPGPARHLTLSADGTRLWASLGSKARTIVVLDVSEPEIARRERMVTPPFLAHDVVFAPDGRAWVTSGSRAALAVYEADATRPALILSAAGPPQHIAFSGSRAYVASGEDGIVRVHRLDGRVVHVASHVPDGSYNIVFGGATSPIGPVAATPSLDRGTLSLLAPRGSLGTVEKVARSAHDACLVEAG